MRTKRIDPDAIDMDFLKQEFNRFRSDLAGVKDKIGGNASEALDQISSYLNGDNISSRVSSMEAQLEYLTSRLKDGSKDAMVKLEKEVGNRPLTSIAIAFGAGILAAQLFRRS